MSVKIKKRGSKWYVYVNYHGRRKNRAVGTREAAEMVRRELEARLAIGDPTFLDETHHKVPTFGAYAEQWLTTYVDVQCKQSTKRSYEQLLRLHVMPRFGSKLLTDIRRDEVKRFVAELSRATREVNGTSVLKFSRNTLRLIISALRAVLNAALEDSVVETNAASKVGKFAKTEKPARQAGAMTRKETEEFLAAVREVRPRWYPFFLTALCAGLRKGELIALKWGDIHFGDSANDPNRYIFVQRSYYQGRFTTPKGNRSRRVDLSKYLRSVLARTAQPANARGLRCRTGEHRRRFRVYVAGRNRDQAGQHCETLHESSACESRPAPVPIPQPSTHIWKPADSARSLAGLREGSNGPQLDSGHGGRLWAPGAEREYCLHGQSRYRTKSAPIRTRDAPSGGGVTAAVASTS